MSFTYDGGNPVSSGFILGASENPIYVNLNTTSIAVYPLENDASASSTPGTVSVDSYISDLATANTNYKNQVMTVTFFKMSSDGKLITYQKNTTSPTDASVGYIGTYTTETTENVSVKATGSASFAPGRYVCCFNIFKASDSDHPVFIDTVSFYVKAGKTTVIGGRCSVQTAIEEVAWEPGIAGAGNNYDIGHDSTERYHADITAVTVQNNTTYVLYPDSSTTTNHTITNTSNTGSKLQLGEGVKDFAVDLNGTNVVTTNDNGITQNTTFVTLGDGVTMDLVNNGDQTAYIGNVVNSSKVDVEEVCSTIEVNGGTLNVTAPDQQIVVSGPSRNNDGTYVGREGAINMKGSGGTINLTGNVCIGKPFPDTDGSVSNDDPNNAVKGITSYYFPGTSTSTNNKTTTLTEPTKTTININVLDGASIWVCGDNDETPAGIYLVGNSNFTADDTVNIHLHDADIVVDSTGNNDVTNTSQERSHGYGIRLEQFGEATINIVIDKGSTIAMDWGNCISIADCKGTINLTIVDSNILPCGGGYRAIEFSNCSGPINLNLDHSYFYSIGVWSRVQSVGWCDVSGFNIDFGTGCSGTKTVNISSDTYFWRYGGTDPNNKILSTTGTIAARDNKLNIYFGSDTTKKSLSSSGSLYYWTDNTNSDVLTQNGLLNTASSSSKPAITSYLSVTKNLLTIQDYSTATNYTRCPLELP